MTMEAKNVMTRGRRSKNRGRAEKKNLMANRGLKSSVCVNYPNAPSPNLKRDEVKFIDCTAACNIKD
jgi:hypothetical protein